MMFGDQIDALRVSRAVTRLTVYRRCQVMIRRVCQVTLGKQRRSNVERSVNRQPGYRPGDS